MTEGDRVLLQDGAIVTILGFEGDRVIDGGRCRGYCAPGTRHPNIVGLDDAQKSCYYS